MEVPLALLIVEDSPGDTDLILHALRGDGLSCTWQRAETEQDYAQLLDTAPDIILTGYSQPLLDAPRALALLQERGLDIPCIVVGDTAGEDIAVACMKAGAADYLLKDRLTRLGMAVRCALQEKRLRDEQRRAIEELRASRDQLAAILHGLAEGITVQDPTGRVVFANDAAARFLGYPSPPDFLAAPPGDWMSVYEALEESGQPLDLTRLPGRRALRGEPSSETIMRYRTRATGEERWSMSRATPLFDNDGHVSMAVNIIQDITERKHAEQALRFQAHLLDIIGQAVIATDHDGLVTFWNHAAEEMYGWSAAEALGRPIRNLLPVIELPEHSKDLMAFVNQGDSHVSEFMLQRRDGKNISVLAVTTPLHDHSGAVTGLVGVSTDITERRRAEELLATERDLFQTLMDTVPDAIYFKDEHLRFVRANRAEALKHGLSDPAVMIGKTDFDFYAAAQAREQFAREQRLVETAEPLVNNLEEESSPDRPHQWILATAMPVVRDGKVRGLVGISRDVTELKQAEQEVALRISHLSALRQIDMAITASLDLRLTLGVVLTQVRAQLGMDAAQVLLLNHHTHVLEPALAQGFRGVAATHPRLRLGQGHAGRAALERRLISVPDLRDEMVTRQALVTEERFVTYVALPLLAKGQVHGVLEVLHRAPRALNLEWMDYLETLAGQAAIAVDNALMFADMKRANTELLLAYDTTIEGWSRALELRDKETEGHSQRVTEMALTLARTLGMSDEQLVHMRRGALLHDIGKMGIPDRILLKPGPLSEEEWDIMRQHPTYAYEVLLPITYLRPALDIPYRHHEKWDGTGYPNGLQREQIPLAARIFAVVDVWDALTSDRPYRAAWSARKTRDYIRSLAGSHFDPIVVDALLTHLQDTVPNRP